MDRVKLAVFEIGTKKEGYTHFGSFEKNRSGLTGSGCVLSSLFPVDIVIVTS